MNENKFMHVSLLLGQLQPALSGDEECKNLIAKLMHRVGVLGMGELDPSRLVEEMGKLPAVANLSLEQLRQMAIGHLMTLFQEQEKSIAARARFTEMADTFETYVKALEERCRALTEEFKNSGGDASKYPPVEKP